MHTLRRMSFYVLRVAGSARGGGTAESGQGYMLYMCRHACRYPGGEGAAGGSQWQADGRGAANAVILLLASLEMASMIAFTVACFAQLWKETPVCTVAVH